MNIEIIGQDKKVVKAVKKKINRCYLCKEAEDQVTELMVEGNRFVCDNCLINR